MQSFERSCLASWLHFVPLSTRILRFGNTHTHQEDGDSKKMFRNFPGWGIFDNGAPFQKNTNYSDNNSNNNITTTWTATTTTTTTKRRATTTTITNRPPPTKTTTTTAANSTRTNHTTHLPTRTCAHSHAHTYAHTHTPTHTLYIHTHERAHTHTHTLTRKYAQALHRTHTVPTHKRAPTTHNVATSWLVTSTPHPHTVGIEPQGAALDGLRLRRETNLRHMGHRGQALERGSFGSSICGWFFIFKKRFSGFWVSNIYFG